MPPTHRGNTPRKEKRKMLTKETTKKAEEIKAEISPFLSKAKKLADKMAQASKETRQAQAIAYIWQYKGEDLRYTESLTDTQRNTESEQAKNLYATNRKEWAETTENKWRKLHEKESEEMTARLNYFNVLQYIAKLIAYFLRNESEWLAFYDKKGLESLADYLNENRTSEKISIYRDGGAVLTPFTSSEYYIYLNISVWGFNCLTGNEWGSFKRVIEEKWKPTRPEPKPIYTNKQVKSYIAKLEKQKQQAENLRKENYNLGYDTGLCYFVEIMDTITAKRWKMRY